jgi:hypothetical protein
MYEPVKQVSLALQRHSDINDTTRELSSRSIFDFAIINALRKYIKYLINLIMRF